jgi:signal transduction histidine kinase
VQLHELNDTLEEKVSERTSEVKALVAQKDRFISQLGHDLKTPLTPMLGLLPLLQADEDDPHRAKMLDVVLRSANFMKDLVHKTLTQARVNSPDTEMNMGRINLASFTRDIVSDYQVMPDHGQSVHIETEIDGDIFVQADGLLLQEVLANLIDNALKYGTEPQFVSVGAECGVDKVTVKVTDHGIGIAPEELTQIFDEFYKIDNSRHDLASSGLGLSICRRIVEKHGGRMWVESPGLGHGSTFCFTLPWDPTGGIQNAA